MAESKGQIEVVGVSSLTPDNRNANRGTERGSFQLEQSLRKFGAGRSILVDRNGRIIAGNKTAEAAADIGLDEVILVRTSGKQVVAVMREDLDLDSPEARELALADNRVGQVSLDWDAGVLADYAAGGVDLGEWFADWELEDLEIDASFSQADDEFDEDDLFELPLPMGVPDSIWPSDNEYGIPTLDPTRQADAFDLPIETWGAKRRGTSAGTILFYTDDGRFSALWKEPYKVLKAGPVNVVEPNYSVYKDFPRAIALYRTYQKRWLARYWQSMGVRIFVDLNVNPAYYEDNLIGVPQGWKAYATRGYTDRLGFTEQELAMAQERAGGPVLFMVYGGGAAVRDWCKARAADGVLWVAEDMDRGKGKYLDELGSKQDG